MPETIKQPTCPEIARSAVLADTRHEAGPMRRTAANGQKRRQHDTLKMQYGSQLYHAPTKLLALARKARQHGQHADQQSITPCAIYSGIASKLGRSKTI